MERSWILDDPEFKKLLKLRVIETGISVDYSSIQSIYQSIQIVPGLFNMNEAATPLYVSCSNSRECLRKMLIKKLIPQKNASEVGIEEATMFFVGICRTFDIPCRLVHRLYYFPSLLLHQSIDN
jgi:hypothetical protein